MPSLSLLTLSSEKKERLLKDLIDFFTKTIADRLFAWMDKHTIDFEDGKEYKLEYTQLFEQFSSMFDQGVETEKDLDSRDIVQFLKESKDGETVVDVILTMFDFETFVLVMRDPAKQRYLHNVVNSYSDLLGK